MKSTYLLLAAALILGVSACSSEPAQDHRDKTPAATPQAAAPAHPTADPHAAPSPHATDPHANPTPHPATMAEQAAMAHGGANVTGSAKKGTVEVPAEVKGKWKACSFIVVDRESSEAKEVTVGLGGEHRFGNGHLILRVKEFLPDLKIMDDNVYTSVSNNPENPAAYVTVSEDGEEIFDGWLFSEFPGMHPFQHPRFGVTLKAGIPS